MEKKNHYKKTTKLHDTNFENIVFKSMLVVWLYFFVFIFYIYSNTKLSFSVIF